VAAHGPHVGTVGDAGEEAEHARENFIGDKILINPIIPFIVKVR
jgi:hypothetical protein